MRTEDHAVRHPELEQTLRGTVARFLEQYDRDPCATAQAATWMIDLLADMEADVAERRRAAVRRMRGEGWTFAQIAAELGTTRARVHQIATQ